MTTACEKQAIVRTLWKVGVTIITSVLVAFLIAFIPTIVKLSAFATEMRLAVQRLEEDCEEIEEDVKAVKTRVHRLECQALVAQTTPAKKE